MLETLEGQGHTKETSSIQQPKPKRQRREKHPEANMAQQK